MNTSIKALADFGQSIWLDYISCSLIRSGELKEKIEEGIRGLTSNPAIFNEAISHSTDYDKEIIRLSEEGKGVFEIYDALTIKDIQDAADIFRGIYEETDQLDGYVSLEINPKLAMDTATSIAEAKRLVAAVRRPNLMIKVPATAAGFSVVEELLSEGINVNVTLIFSLAQYQKTVRAYLNGMNRLAQKKKDLRTVRSVASVFVSRVDSAVDKMIDEKLMQISDENLKVKLKSIKGKAAVSNCQLIFEQFNRSFASVEFDSLKQKGACVQRVLWASTGTKNPQYSDIKYVTELLLKPTVNTLPEKTISAFLDHGVVKETMVYDIKAAQDTLETLREFGIDIQGVCLKLLDAGVLAFEQSFENLCHSIEAKSKSLSAAS